MSFAINFWPGIRSPTGPTTISTIWLIVDIDLTILGKNSSTFDNYDRAIRKEYAVIADEPYRVGQLAVLERFLDRPAIFRTPTIANRYEAPARAKLRRAMGRLMIAQ